MSPHSQEGNNTATGATDKPDFPFSFEQKQMLFPGL